MREDDTRQPHAIVTQGARDDEDDALIALDPGRDQSRVDACAGMMGERLASHGRRFGGIERLR